LIFDSKVLSKHCDAPSVRREEGANTEKKKGGKESFFEKCFRGLGLYQVDYNFNPVEFS
jgi:hypothetical protein